MTFTEELRELINRHSMENNSNTPDFILAQFMFNCLQSYESAIKSRDEWYSFSPFKHKISMDGLCLPKPARKRLKYVIKKENK